MTGKEAFWKRGIELWQAIIAGVALAISIIPMLMGYITTTAQTAAHEALQDKRIEEHQKWIDQHEVSSKEQDKLITTINASMQANNEILQEVRVQVREIRGSLRR